MKDKRTIPYLIALIAIIVAIPLMVNFGFIEQTATGGEVLSLQRTDFISDDSQIQGEAWLLTIVQNGLSQYAKGTFSKSEIKDGDVSASENLEVTIESSPQKCSYDLKRESDYLYSVESIKIYAWSISSATDKCAGLKGFKVAKKEFDLIPSSTSGYEYACFKKTIDATKGNIAFNTLSFTADMVAKIGSKEYKGTISNTGVNQVWLADGIVQASWSGNLQSGEECPTAVENGVTALRKDDAWRITSQKLWDDYKSFDRSGFDTCIQEEIGSYDHNYDRCVSKYNSLAQYSLTTKEFSSEGGSSAKITSQEDSGKTEIELGKLIQFPVFTMRIKADKLGVVVPTGRPSILDAESACFGTGDKGFVVADIQNIGGQTSTFVSSLSCDAPFSQSGTSIRTQFRQDEIKTVYIPIIAETAKEKEEGLCTLEVSDSGSPNNKDSVQLKTCVKGINICTPSEERCVGEKLQKCNTAGTGWVTVSEKAEACVTSECSIDTDCPERAGFSVECKTGLFSTDRKCVYTEQKTCEAWWSVAGITIIPNMNMSCISFSTPLKIVLIITAFIIVFAIAMKNLPFEPSQEKWKRASALILGILASALTWYYFWVLIGIIILYIIFKMVKR